MRGILLNLGLLEGQDGQERVFTDGNEDGSQRKRMSASALPDQFCPDLNPSFANYTVAAAYGAGLGPIPSADMQSGWAESIWAH